MQATAKAIPFQSQAQAAPKLTPRRREATFTLDQAFDCAWQPGQQDPRALDTLNVERAVRSVALLLDWASELGNTDVEGRTAGGLADVLNLAAERIAQVRP